MSVHQPDCRMMCASSSAYLIVPGRPFDVPTSGEAGAVWEAVQWTATPVPVFGGTDSTDACLVGINSDGVVVAYRGTLPIGLEEPLGPEIYDWLVNDILGLAPMDVPSLGDGVTVHSGWWGSVQAIWEQTVAEIEKVLTDGVDIYFTGHSKGGPMATIGSILFATQLGDKYPNTTVNVYTYASPRPGNSAFATLCEGKVPNHKRWEYAYDIVPLAPPSPSLANWLASELKKHPLSNEVEQAFVEAFLKMAADWDYKHVGDLRYIGTDGTLHTVFTFDDEHRLEFDILPHIEEVGLLKALGGAHCHLCRCTNSKNEVVCDGGYMSGTCAGSVCDTITPKC